MVEMTGIAMAMQKEINRGRYNGLACGYGEAVNALPPWPSPQGQSAHLTRPDPSLTPFSRTTTTLCLVISLRRSHNISLGLEETARMVCQPGN